MGYNQMIRRALTDVGNWLVDAQARWTNEIDQAAVGNLTPTLVLSDTTALFQRGTAIWWELIAHGEPIPPLIYIEESAGSVAGFTPSGTAYVDGPLDPAATLEATPLQQLGGAATLAVANPPDVIAQTCREEIKVTLNVPTGTKVSAGLYQGLVLLDGSVVATVVARLTP